ncbi:MULTISPECIES: envelope stress response membrane protein PspB [Moritella]|uniref:Phage shock protein B n=1 Tax=Moritella viscosa TaxID=80854 RepID=A0A090IFD6_9GAMM|nr:MULTISPECIES: envelope stress response membrane protein PspB [Moritella]QUM81375.1 envelope stress response membrane protein PspB [Moritella sp. 5]CED59542.1 phage shock protein B [Moritella viscosa]SGY86840.1 Phage shock protein B [Moritella viscosa]SGY88346.1 Phage shock protein B [Moritella viscosa]SGY88423.1 Phage shock protein B [Moritella viscosa]
MDFIQVPLTVFLVFVAPLWLILAYRSKRQSNQGLSKKDKDKLQTLISRTEQLQDRVISLEQILDEESPKWRDR